jgi:hypothetical protein
VSRHFVTCYGSYKVVFWIQVRKFIKLQVINSFSSRPLSVSHGLQLDLLTHQHPNNGHSVLEVVEVNFSETSDWNGMITRRKKPKNHNLKPWFCGTNRGAYVQKTKSEVHRKNGGERKTKKQLKSRRQWGSANCGFPTPNFDILMSVTTVHFSTANLCFTLREITPIPRRLIGWVPENG